MYKISDENFEIAIEKFLKMVKQNDSKKYSEILQINKNEFTKKINQRIRS